VIVLLWDVDVCSLHLSRRIRLYGDQASRLHKDVNPIHVALRDLATFALAGDDMPWRDDPFTRHD